ncbi:NET domain-containing protein [Entamoeba marina]
MNSSQSLPHDFVYSHIQKYLREKCHLALFDDNMDIKRELDDIADTTGVEAVREYCELFTNISEAYGDGTPQAVVAELCLEALKSFELQYIMPEEMSKERKHEGKGMEKQRSILLKRKEELEKEVNELKEELKDSIELCQPERIETTRDLKEIPQRDTRRQKRKTKRDLQSTTTHMFEPPPPITNGNDEVFSNRSEDEMKKVFQKLTKMNPNQLKKIKEIINPGDGDTVLTFDLGSLTDEKFRLIKNHILTMD